jgi:hypothetical protein
MNNTFDCTNHTIENVLRMLRPILEEKEVIGHTITMTELAKICHNYRHRLPVLRGYRAKQMTEEIHDTFHGSSFFQFDDLDIGFFIDEDANGRRKQMIEFQYSVSKEQQCLNSLKQQAIENPI